MRGLLGLANCGLFPVCFARRSTKHWLFVCRSHSCTAEDLLVGGRKLQKKENERRESFERGIRIFKIKKRNRTASKAEHLQCLIIEYKKQTTAQVTRKDGTDHSLLQLHIHKYSCLYMYLYMCSGIVPCPYNSNSGGGACIDQMLAVVATTHLLAQSYRPQTSLRYGCPRQRCGSPPSSERARMSFC